MAEKIYVGSGKKSPQYDITSISVCLSDIPKEHITKSQNGKSYVNLKVSAKREPDQYGKTHSVEVDTWKPEEKPKAQPAPQVKDSTDELPW